MKILMGLLGYSCKIHRKRSRVSFSEDRTSQPRPDKQASNEENDEKISKPSDDNTDVVSDGASATNHASGNKKPKNVLTQDQNSHGKKCSQRLVKTELIEGPLY
jgi:hypothetical protein